MATFSKRHLSGLSGGAPLLIAETVSAGNTVHTTDVSSTVIDEIWLYAHNTSGSAVTLTIEYGGTTNPDSRITLSIPAQAGLTLVLPGLILSGTGAASRSVRAFASTSNVITVSGYVNRIS